MWSIRHNVKTNVRTCATPRQTCRLAEKTNCVVEVHKLQQKQNIKNLKNKMCEQEQKFRVTQFVQKIKSTFTHTHTHIRLIYEKLTYICAKKNVISGESNSLTLLQLENTNNWSSNVASQVILSATTYVCRLPGLTYFAMLWHSFFHSVCFCGLSCRHTI